MNILLVSGDEEGSRKVEKFLCEGTSWPCEVKRVSTLSEALEVLNHLGTHAAVLDLDFPNAHTGDWIQQIRTADSALPIVALVAHADSALGLELLHRGAQDVLGKDELSGPTLSRTLRYALERSLLARELKDRDDQYRMIVENAEEGIWTLDARDQTIFVNRKLADLLGYTPDEMMGKSPLDFMDDEGREIATAKLANLHRGINSRLDFQFRRKDGSPLWTITSTNALYDENGRYVGAMGLITDITERKKQELALSRLAAIVESSSDAIIGTDLEGCIVSWNPGAEQLYGYSAREAIGRSIRFTVPPDRQLEVDQALVALRKGIPVPTRDTLRKNRTGELLAVSVALSPVRDGQGLAIGCSAIIRNISEQKKLEAQFHQAQKMEAVGRLAGGVAHDFNNLLTVICGYTSLLLGQKESEPMAQELQEIYKAGERAAGLTRQLLAFSRKQILKLQIIELNPLVKELEKMLRRLIGEDIEFVTSLQGSLGRIKGDVGQIEQILMNLAVNARDAMPRGGRLIVETRNVDIDAGAVAAGKDIRPGSYVMLAVSDTGMGMDKEIQSHLFEPFFTTKGQGKGTGLGLSTIYGIVKQVGGHINVYSEPGRGSSFRVYFPNVTAEAQPAAPEEAIGGSLEGKETILVVEDNETVMKLTCEVLRQKGYQIRSASNGSDALDLCTESGFPHLLLTDMVLPGMDGLTLCRKMTARNFEVKTILMTGYTEAEILHQGVGESGVVLVHKPFSPNVLLGAVRRVLDGPTTSLVPERRPQLIKKD